MFVKQIENGLDLTGAAKRIAAVYDTSLELIDKKFGSLVVARIPMFDGEIRRVEMLRKVII